MGLAFFCCFPIEYRSNKPESTKPRPTEPTAKPPKNKNKNREAAAAVVIQRWRRGLVEAREAAGRAIEDAACRRWAVRKLHRAYVNRWRYALVDQKQRRLQWEEEVGWLGLANILSGVDLDRGLLGIFSENFIQLYVYRGG